ncbi:2,3-bisphosphoglycerate-independent phosphoglycerate mutase [Patescibacteria group bacterium]|nr:2,3-bisphosphoglycerate-independent phosphoglycerate mutase [Patescibacteria group bacterium]MBU1886086.1 2,3-bisphosphoglycerate-independent phosphoglycerate mutase [Patescibacteria group bacterium]
MSNEKPKVMLVVMDGWGIKHDYPGNAITQANTPFYDSLLAKYPHTQLDVSGEAVGLPMGQMGTSEVNHFTIGAGKVINQDLVRITKAIEDGSFYENENLLKTFKHVKQHNSALHVWGLISDGGVHSHIRHAVATVKAAANAGLTKVYLHVVTDGRDTSPTSGVRFVEELENNLARIGIGRVVSIVGRYYAMDRDKNWDRTDQAFKLYTAGQGENFTNSTQAVQASYDAGVTDEFIKPVVVGEPVKVSANDAFITVNFRSDRPKQIVEKFIEQRPENLLIATMTLYSDEYDSKVEVIFPQDEVDVYLGKIISQAGLKQLHITETEKFNHMTFFLNCKHNDADPGEDRFMFDSYSDIATHDERPEMRAPDIADKIVENIRNGDHSAIFTNLCNADMVGHTGNIPAAIKGCEAVDQALGKIVPAALEHGFTVFITADHGNAEEMLTEPTDGSEPQMITSHSTNPVPLIMVSNQYQELAHQNGSLIDIAPTMLKILGLEIPEEMVGESFV